MCDFPVTYSPETYAPALSGTPSNLEGELVTTVGVESAYVKVYVYVAPVVKSVPTVVTNSSPRSTSGRLLPKGRKKLGEVADRPEECVNQGKDANQERALE